MSWIKHTGSRYHNQDTNIGCGAASAMMILAEMGVPYSALDQDDLYTLNHDHNAKPTGWATDPYGLNYTLNNRKPAGHLGFVVYKPTTEAEGTRKIVHTLHHYNVSPAVLVFGCMHWIVVPGVQTDVEPVPGSNYTVEGFWIHNPTHHTPEPPPPHSATDACGTGGTLGNANEFVTYAGWQSTYFTGCNYDHPSGSPQYISVCDPEEPELNLPRRRDLQFLANGQRLIVPEQAIEFSERGLKEYQLFEDKRIANAVKNAQPGKPQLVLRLDRLNTYYYLVPWETKEGVTALAQVDARFGIFHSIHLQEKPSRQEFLSKDAVLKRVANKRFNIPERKTRMNLLDVPEHQGRLMFYPEVAALSPTLVWRPCQESYSPYLPFHQYTIGENTIYVRIDGKVFNELTTIGPYGD